MSEDILGSNPYSKQQRIAMMSHVPIPVGGYDQYPPIMARDGYWGKFKHRRIHINNKLTNNDW